jgi:VIT1/CCC1 family predicted Fe2+/Mn2+ transporter
MERAIRKAALEAQRAEMTEYHIYMALAKRSTIPSNRKLLERIAKDELRHYKYWREQTKVDVRPSRHEILLYLFFARTFGVTFTLQLREAGEKSAQEKYAKLRDVPGVRALISDEEGHEQMLITMLKDERLEYAGAVVLGLNDALVELTGVLAGLTLALRDGRLVAIAGLVTGVAAAMSMAASGYLQAKEDGHRSPLKSAAYTGGTYILVVMMLIAPYFILSSLYSSLLVTLSIALIIIAVYTFYITTAKKISFWRRFGEMAAISLGVAAVSFMFGWLLRTYVGL